VIMVERWYTQVVIGRPCKCMLQVDFTVLQKHKKNMYDFTMDYGMSLCEHFAHRPVYKYMLRRYKAHISACM
jgi:hypothetical protein